MMDRNDTDSWTNPANMHPAPDDDPRPERDNAERAEWNREQERIADELTERACKYVGDGTFCYQHGANVDEHVGTRADGSSVNELTAAEAEHWKLNADGSMSPR